MDKKIAEIKKIDKKLVGILEDIKKILILDLITRGVQAKDIAQILNVGKSTITRMVPARQIKVKK